MNKRLIDETNEYKFPASDASDTNKKPDKIFFIKKNNPELFNTFY